MIYISAYVNLYVYVILDNSNCYKLSTIVRVMSMCMYTCNVCLSVVCMPYLISLNFIDFTRATTMKRKRRPARVPRLSVNK